MCEGVHLGVHKEQSPHWRLMRRGSAEETHRSQSMAPHLLYPFESGRLLCSQRAHTSLVSDQPHQCGRECTAFPVDGICRLRVCVPLVGYQAVLEAMRSALEYAGNCRLRELMCHLKFSQCAVAHGNLGRYHRQSSPVGVAVNVERIELRMFCYRVRWLVSAAPTALLSGLLWSVVMNQYGSKYC